MKHSEKTLLTQNNFCLKIHSWFQFGVNCFEKMSFYLGPCNWLMDDLNYPAYFDRYSCNMITTTWIQISRQSWNGLFSNINHQIMIQLTPIASRSKIKKFKSQKNKKFALNSQKQAYQILINDDELCIQSLSSIHIAILSYEILKNWHNVCRRHTAVA